MKFAVFVLIVAFGFAQALAQCGSRPDSLKKNHFCKLESVEDEGVLVGAIDNCAATNDENPFFGLSELCVDLLKEDGDDCVFAAAKFKCSFICQTCGASTKRPCFPICAEVVSECPAAMAANCFPNLQSQQCELENDQHCTTIGISESKVDDFVGGSGGGSNSATSLNYNLALMNAGLCIVAIFILAF